MECKSANCESAVHARGLCAIHYARFMRKQNKQLALEYGLECSVESCKRPATRKGLCEAHSMQLRRTGVIKDIAYTRPYKMEPGLKCKAEDCSQPSVSKGFCKTHYARVWATGSTETKTLTSKGPWSDWARSQKPNEEANKNSYAPWRKWAKVKIGGSNVHRRHLSPRTLKPSPSPDWICWSVVAQFNRTVAAAGRPAKGTWGHWAGRKQMAIARREVMINGRKSKIQTPTETDRVAGV